MITGPTFRPLNPAVAGLVPDTLFEASELARFAQPAHKPVFGGPNAGRRRDQLAVDGHGAFEDQGPDVKRCRIVPIGSPGLADITHNVRL